MLTWGQRHLFITNLQMIFRSKWNQISLFDLQWQILSMIFWVETFCSRPNSLHHLFSDWFSSSDILQVVVFPRLVPELSGTFWLPKFYNIKVRIAESQCYKKWLHVIKTYVKFMHPTVCNGPLNLPYTCKERSGCEGIFWCIFECDTPQIPQKTILLLYFLGSWILYVDLRN